MMSGAAVDPRRNLQSLICYNAAHTVLYDVWYVTNGNLDWLDSAVIRQIEG